jgi:hypothetical protein
MLEQVKRLAIARAEELARAYGCGRFPPFLVIASADGQLMMWEDDLPFERQKAFIEEKLARHGASAAAQVICGEESGGRSQVLLFAFDDEHEEDWEAECERGNGRTMLSRFRMRESRRAGASWDYDRWAAHELDAYSHEDEEGDAGGDLEALGPGEIVVSAEEVARGALVGMIDPADEHVGRWTRVSVDFPETSSGGRRGMLQDAGIEFDRSGQRCSFRARLATADVEIDLTLERQSRDEYLLRLPLLERREGAPQLEVVGPGVYRLRTGPDDGGGGRLWPLRALPD